MRYERCRHSELATFDAYLDSLSSPIDSFLEDHILESQFHRILDEGQEIGSFAIHNGALLTQFHVVGGARRYGQDIFSEILTQFRPEAALVPTCDEFFLSHALDKHSELKRQALFFVDGGEQVGSPSVRPKVEYRLAEPPDLPEIKAISGTFLDDPDHGISRQEVHVGHLHGEMVAVGLIIQSRLWPNQASIGMFTRKTHRRQGIGTQTIFYLKQVCRNAGIVPLAGCGYDNRSSQLTLQAAGMITMTRLLRLTL